MGGLIPLQRTTMALRRPVAGQLGGLAHDLRNVMASLELCAEVLGQPGVLMPEHGYLAGEMRSVADASIGLLRLIGDMAEGKTGSPGGKSAASPRSLRDTLHGLRGLLASVADAGVAVEIDCAHCSGAVAIPTEELARVLVNLVRNACDAMSPSGSKSGSKPEALSGSGSTSQAGGKVTITARTRGGRVLLTVEDTGPGVPAALAGRIFTPGFSTRAAGAGRKQTPHRRARPEAQRGLGLAIARELIEANGGGLRLTPSAAGACFAITLPLTDVMPPAGAEGRIACRGGRR
jgi:signal transduction histidine kinase